MARWCCVRAVTLLEHGTLKGLGHRAQASSVLSEQHSSKKENFIPTPLLEIIDMDRLARLSVLKLQNKIEFQPLFKIVLRTGRGPSCVSPSAK